MHKMATKVTIISCILICMFAFNQINYAAAVVSGDTSRISIISKPPDSQTIETGILNRKSFTLSWKADALTSLFYAVTARLYELKQNGVIISSGTWSDNVLKTFTLTAPTRTAIGSVTYTYQIRFYTKNLVGVINANVYDLISVTFVVYDTDTDGLANYDEVIIGTNKNDPDSDDDGLTDGLEVNTYHTNPLLLDTDGDGMDDGWEVQYSLNPLSSSDKSTDLDSDGLVNYWEYVLKTNPRNLDTDGDGITDANEDNDGDTLTNGIEVNTYHTNPVSIDTDSDGIDDLSEITIYHTSPTNLNSFPALPTTTRLYRFENNLIDDGIYHTPSGSNSITYSAVESGTYDIGAVMDSDTDYMISLISASFTQGTFECLFTPTSFIDWSIIMGANEPSGYLTLFVGFSSGGRLMAHHPGYSNLYGTTVLEVNKKYHIMFCFGPDGVELYINGNIEAQDHNPPSGTLPSSLSIGIGKIGTIAQVSKAARGIVYEFRVDQNPFHYQPIANPILYDTRMLVDFENDGADYVSSSDITIVDGEEFYFPPMTDYWLTTNAIVGAKSLQLATEGAWWTFHEYFTQGTIECYFKPTSITDDTVILEAGYNDYNPYTPVLISTMIVGIDNGGKIIAKFKNGGSWNTPLVSTTVLQLNKLYHIAFTFGPTGTHLYINGIEEAKNPTDHSVLYYNPYEDANSICAGNVFDSVWGSASGIFDEIRLSNTSHTVFPRRILQSVDWDLDNLLNQDEPLSGTNVLNKDCDSDQILDGDEVVGKFGVVTNPVSSDTDSDGLSDWSELFTFSTMPTMIDTDLDTLTDYTEIWFYLTSPLSSDSENDGMDDGWEISYGYPLSPITVDANYDYDGDLLLNIEEYRLELNPLCSDTDGDGENDGIEDNDGDGHSNYEELHSTDQDPNDAMDNYVIPYPSIVEFLFNMKSLLKFMPDIGAFEFYIGLDGDAVVVEVNIDFSISSVLKKFNIPKISSTLLGVLDEIRINIKLSLRIDPSPEWSIIFEGSLGLEFYFWGWDIPNIVSIKVGAGVEGSFEWDILEEKVKWELKVYGLIEGKIIYPITRFDVQFAGVKFEAGYKIVAKELYATLVLKFVRHFDDPIMI